MRHLGRHLEPAAQHGLTTDDERLPQHPRHVGGGERIDERADRGLSHDLPVAPRGDRGGKPIANRGGESLRRERHDRIEPVEDVADVVDVGILGPTFVGGVGDEHDRAWARSTGGRGRDRKASRVDRVAGADEEIALPERLCGRVAEVHRCLHAAAAAGRVVERGPGTECRRERG